LGAELVQIDSADVRPESDGHWYKHSSARDVVSRCYVLGVYIRATAVTARDFLKDVIERMPTPVKATQVDDGSELKAEFEEAAVRRAKPLRPAPSVTQAQRLRQPSTDSFRKRGTSALV
jgi:hypothetical protein